MIVTRVRLYYNGSTCIEKVNEPADDRIISIGAALLVATRYFPEAITIDDMAAQMPIPQMIALKQWWDKLHDYPDHCRATIVPDGLGTKIVYRKKDDFDYIVTR